MGGSAALPDAAATGSTRSSTSLNSRSAVLPMSALARSGSWTPGSWTRMRLSPCCWMEGSATPNWSTRLRMVSSPWRTKLSRWLAISWGRMASTKRPALWSASFASKLGKSFWTSVCPSAQPAGEASWIWISVLPRRSAFCTAMPLASRAVRTRSAVRSVWIWSALSMSTPSTRWMPPWRSRPRLIVFLGGYR